MPPSKEMKAKLIAEQSQAIFDTLSDSEKLNLV